MQGGLVSSFLNLPVVSRVRRNHALEHATLQILAEREGETRLMGRSSVRGFTVYGDVDTDKLLQAAQDGLKRLRAGQRALAVHPNCGSNYAVAGVIAGLGAFLALGGLNRDDEENVLERLARLPMACALGTLGVIASRPLGAAFQAHVTTEADVGELEITNVTRSVRAGTVIHFVQTEG
jgi:hypothetical protein